MYFWDASCCIDLLCDLSVPFSPHGHTLLVNMGVSIGPDRSHKENCCVRAAGQVRTLINARAKIYKYNSDFKKSNNEVGLKKKKNSKIKTDVLQSSANCVDKYVHY